MEVHQLSWLMIFHGCSWVVSPFIQPSIAIARDGPDGLPIDGPPSGVGSLRSRSSTRRGAVPRVRCVGVDEKFDMAI